MRTRTMLASAVLATAAATSGGMALAGSSPAHAAGTVTETVSQVNRMVNAKCYDETRKEVRYYSHSSRYGWRLLPKPAVTVSTSRHCLS